jgi:hypothetical protein
VGPRDRRRDHFARIQLSPPPGLHLRSGYSISACVGYFLKVKFRRTGTGR